MAITYLHNFLRQSKASPEEYTPAGSIDIKIDGNLVQGSGDKPNLLTVSTVLVGLSLFAKKTCI